MSSVTLVHHAKAEVWNEMPFGRDTHVVQVTLFQGSGPAVPLPHKKGGFGVGISKFAAMPLLANARLL